jgi:hypothetical protein
MWMGKNGFCNTLLRTLCIPPLIISRARRRHNEEIRKARKE